MTGGCKSNPTRSAPRPDRCPAGNTMMMMMMLMLMFKMSALLSPHSGNSTLYNLLDPQFRVNGWGNTIIMISFTMFPEFNPGADNMYVSYVW